MNTTTQFIEVKYNITVERGWYQVIMNYYDQFHKRHQKWKSLGIKDIPGNKNKAKTKAKEIARQFEEELNTPKEQTKAISSADTNVTTHATSDILFGDYLLNYWLPSIKSSVEITTYSGYEDKVRIASKYFNDLGIKLVDLKKNDIKAFYTYLKTVRNVKNKTVK